jgi:hypothetical protein
MGRQKPTTERHPGGTYTATREGKTVEVRLGQEFDDLVIDKARANYDAYQAIPLVDPTPAEQVIDDASEYLALVDWKVLGYRELVKQADRNPPPELAQKLTYWESEYVRLHR